MACMLTSITPIRKLGLFSVEEDDDGLFESLFATMADTSADFTGTFRELSQVTNLFLPSTRLGCFKVKVLFARKTCDVQQRLFSYGETHSAEFSHWALVLCSSFFFNGFC